MSIASVGHALKAYGAALERGKAPWAPAEPGGFAGLVQAGLEGASKNLRAGEAKAVEALSGRASLQDVVEAVTEAELSLQKMTAVRDRVISAYQEIMRMPI